MKKIISSIMLVTILINSISPVYAYNRSDHNKDQSVISSEKRLVSNIDNSSQVGDYIIKSRENIRMYDDKCNVSVTNALDCLGAFMLTVYYDNYYENREIVTKQSSIGRQLVKMYVGDTFKKVAIKENQKSYGKYFEINYFQVTFYAIMGYDLDFRTVFETKSVFDFSKFKFVKKQVKVTEYWARKVSNQQVITGYKTVIDEPAHWETKYVDVVISPETRNYRAFLYETGFGVNGFLYGYGEAVKGTIKFGSEVVDAVWSLDANKITFIKDGKTYFANVITKVDNTAQLFKVIISDTYTNVTTTITFAVDNYIKNPDQLSSLVGSLTYEIALSYLVASTVKKIDVPLINIDSNVLRVYNKYKTIVPRLLVKYGDDLTSMAAKYGDDVVTLVDKYDSKIVKSSWLHADDLDDLAYRLADSTADGSSKFLSEVADEVIDSTSDKWVDGIWNENKFIRGNIIDDILCNNTHHNFPIIDCINLDTKTVISNKSIDPRFKTYLNSTNFKSKLKSYIDKLEKFESETFAGIEIDPSQYDNKVLKLAVPDVQMSLSQKNALKEVINYANTKNIDLNVVIIK